MFPLPHMKGRAVRVVGLGPAGLAAVRALSDAGADVTVWDDDADKREQAGHPAKGPRASLDGLDAVVLCDGGIAAAAKSIIPRAKAAGVEVVTDLDLFHDAMQALEERPQTVGVTGLRGAGAAPLIAHVLEAEGAGVAHGGPGAPCLSLPPPDIDRTYVVELPIARLAAAKRFRADVSVVQGLGTKADSVGLDAVVRAVMRLFRQHAHGDAAVIAVDDGVGQKLCTALQSGLVGKVAAGEVIPVSGRASLGHGVYVLGAQAYSARGGRTQTLGSLARAPAFADGHRAGDAAAAIAACLSLGVAPPQIIKALHGFGAEPDAAPRRAARG